MGCGARDEGKMQNAKGKRQKAKGKRQKICRLILSKPAEAGPEPVEGHAAQLYGNFTQILTCAQNPLVS
jgi:hypothetical protein